MSSRRNFRRPLTDEELLESLENDDLDDLVPPLDNSTETDIEQSDEEDFQPLRDSLQPERKWKKNIKDRAPTPEYQRYSWEEVYFAECTTPSDVFVKLLGKAVQNITFQTNLYATQRNQRVIVTEKDILSFIGIIFFMGYHILPNVESHWSTAEDLKVELVAKTMSRNRFQSILSNLHLNDNSIIPNNNTDKLYKVRPLINSLNSTFMNYVGEQEMCVDESIIKFKGRSSIKQYNPKKPIKRGYKFWILSDMTGFVKKIEIYQGKDEEINHKFSKYTLGARVVLQMTEQDWHKNKIIYFDNYFNSIDLLERLKLEGTLACGTIRRDRKGLPNGMATDKSLKRGDFDHRTSNTGITFYKWKDNRIVTLASNFHGTETVKIKRKLKDGTITYVNGPEVVEDYNKFMGGVDYHDQLRQCYSIDRRSKKWWHRIFWGCIEITFVNAYVIYKKIRDEPKMTVLAFRREVVKGLCSKSPKFGMKLKSTNAGPTPKKRRYNYSVSDEIRLGNRGNHWPPFVERRGRCEMCSAQAIQSKPHSTCSTCGVFLCVNEKKTAL
ncbi:hypothetical protein JTB14_008104 [Gonioctena quinquepunctata]|nr:hypothetical protein JTB14_008104 [Gonioctena quinquepunctata]